MTGARLAEPASPPESHPGFDPRNLLRATIEALGTLDARALDSLRGRAEAVSGWQIAWDERMQDGDAARLATRCAAGDTADDLAETIRLKQTLEELLHSTERSLRVLRGVHENGLRRTRLSSLNAVSEALWGR